MEILPRGVRPAASDVDDGDLHDPPRQSILWELHARRRRRRRRDRFQILKKPEN